MHHLTAAINLSSNKQVIGKDDCERIFIRLHKHLESISIKKRGKKTGDDKLDWICMVRDDFVHNEADTKMFDESLYVELPDGRDGEFVAVSEDRLHALDMDMVGMDAFQIQTITFKKDKVPSKFNPEGARESIINKAIGYIKRKYKHEKRQ